jgi:hypothetical protein|tara:strand:+ start:2741 stop:8002 length:5262 start_codon:yes stop_codon:yes gene_type:complete
VITKLLSNWPEEGVSIDQKMAALRFFIQGLRLVEHEQNIGESLLSMDDLFHGGTNSVLDLHLLKTNVTGKFEIRAVSTLATIDVATYYSVEQSRVPLLIQSAVFISLFAHDHLTSDGITIMEAAGNIRRLITSSRAIISAVPDDLGLLETLEYVVNLKLKRNAVSFAFLKEVKRGWSAFLSLKSNHARTEIIPPRRKLPQKPHVHTQPLPFSGNDLTVEEPEETNQVELKDDSPFPIRAAQRDLFRNQIIETREQFGLLLCPVRLSTIEVSTLQRWLFTTTSTPSSVLVVLSMITALKTHELMGIHITRSSDTALLLQTDPKSFGVVDLQAKCYWRKELDVQNRFKPKPEDLYWLNDHHEWLALPIPDVFFQILNDFFNDSDGGIVEECLGLNDEQQASGYLNDACREIRALGGLHRPITKRALRYSLFACVSDKYGQHNASLIFANNSFSNSTRHYYMSAKAKHLQSLFYQAINAFTQVDLSSDPFPNQEGTVGSRLSISVELFKERLTTKISAVNELLLTVKNEKDPYQLKNIYNLLVAYTVTMFVCATTHRRHNSLFIEHACWSHDYSQVMIADKLFFGESAVRILPIPEILSSQINNSKGWIEQISKRLRSIGDPFARTLSASLSRKGNTPFFGRWMSNNTIKPADTTLIETFLGDDFSLPQNSLRQLFYQSMLQQPNSSSYLDHQMGHVSSALHSFQNTSLRSLHDDEQHQHRSLVQDVLTQLGFVNLKRTKYSNTDNLKVAYFLPKTIDGSNAASIKDLAKNALIKAMEKVKSSDNSIYEILSNELAEEPFVHEEAIKQLDDLLVDKEGNQLDDTNLETLFKVAYFRSPKVEAVFPFKMHIAEHAYRTLYAQFLEVVRVICSQGEDLDPDFLKIALLMSLIFDGEEAINGFFKAGSDKIFTVQDISYANRYLTGNITGQPIMFAGISSVLLALIVRKLGARNIVFDLKKFDKDLGRLKDTGHKTVSHKVLSKLRGLIVTASNEYGHDKWRFILFFKHLDMSLRQGESGVLFGLRQNTVDTKRLSPHALQRLMSPTEYFPLGAQPDISFVQDQLIEKRTYKAVKDRSFYRAFFKDLPQALDDSGNNSKNGIRAYWNRLIGDGQARTSVAELVKQSNALPEIIVLILTWLLEASSRRGKSETGLKVSTIKTYLSTIGPALCELCANKSLLSLDYDDLIDVYQDVIDMGDQVHGQPRLRRLMDFHRQCRRYFQSPKIDWQDLDVALVDDVITRNIISHVEYERAINLLVNDPYLAPSEQEACLVVLIISYRLMTRRAETRRLRVNDWCEQSGLCSIRSNVFGSTKTRNGNRRIPYTVLMTNDEYDRVTAYVQKARKQGGNPPLFYDPLFPDRIRSMDKTFNRVTEALQLVTGDSNTRLYDCRHAGINFVATSLILSDTQSDPIALSIKRWLPCDTFAEFQDNFSKATIGNPSTRHALLPALALMVGHSSATTTISNYVHLTYYWRWMATEGELRSLKILDNEIQILVGMDKSYFSRQKNKSGLSASYCVLDELLSGVEIEGLLGEKGISLPVLELSNIKSDTFSAKSRQIKDIERTLRVLEYISVTTESNAMNLHLESSQYVIEKSDLETAFVTKVWRAYQETLEQDVGYRAFSIPAFSSGVNLPDAFRPKAAEAYLASPEFWEWIKALLTLERAALSRLLVLWGKSWDAMDRVCKVPASERAEWRTILDRLSWYPEFNQDSEVRRYKHGVQVQCHELRVLSQKNLKESVSMLKLSHSLFLLMLQQKLLT